MNLRKLVRETLYKIIKEEENIGDISAAQQLISSMEENGFKKVDSEMNYEEGTLVLVLKSNDETLPYDVSLSMSFVINDLGSYSPGRFGGTADTDIAPYAEPGDWSIKLDNAFVYSKFDEVFRGKDVFQEFFDNNIEEIKGYFDEEIQKKMSDDLEDEGPDPDDAYERYRDSMMDLSEVFGDEFEDEGPQPGDIDYHYQNPETLKGIGNFNDVDWKVFHEELIENTKNNEEYAPGTFSSLFFSKNDITDNILSREEYAMLEDGGLFENFDFYPIIFNKDYFDFEKFYTRAKEIWEKSSQVTYPKRKESMFELETASGNPLNGKSKQSAINYIYKIFKQVDHGQRYRDEAWENVRKIFNLFGEYGMDTVGGYDTEYNPGGISVDEMTPQWKKWKIDFNFTDNKGREKTLVFLLTAHAAGTVQDPWDSYDITFYPIGEKTA